MYIVNKGKKGFVVSIKQAEEFLKKVGKRKNISKFEMYKEDIIYLYNKNATLEIITQYLETKGIKRVKGYNALSSFIKRNVSLTSNNTQKDITKNKVAKNIDPLLMNELLSKEIDL